MKDMQKWQKVMRDSRAEAGKILKQAEETAQELRCQHLSKTLKWFGAALQCRLDKHHEGLCDFGD